MVIPFRLALKNIRRKPERSFLTAVGVLLAVATAVSLLSLSEGVYSRTIREINNQNVDLYVTARNRIASGLSGLPISSTPLPAAARDALFKDPAVLSVAPVVQLFTRIHGKNAVFIGFDPDKFALFFPPSFGLEQGSMYDSAANGVVLGDALSRTLEIGQDDSVSIDGTSFTVTGILAPTGGFQDNFGFMSASNALLVSRTAGYTEIWVQLRDRAKRDAVAAGVERAFPSVTCLTPDQYLVSALAFIRLGEIVEWAIALIGILIALAAAMNTMLISAYERVREYGTLRAIGASRFFVFMLVLCESVLLSLFGGAGGVALGIAGANGLNGALVSLFQLPVPVTSVTPALLFEGVALALFVGVAGAIIPASMVSGVEIVKAIKGE